MKKKILFFLLLCVSACLYSNNASEDSLLSKLSDAQDTTKLKILYELQQMFLYEPKDAYYNDLLFSEAQLQKNEKYIGVALTNRVGYHYRMFNKDSICFHAKIAEAFDHLHDLHTDLFLVRQMLIQFYLEYGDYNLALKKATQLNEEAIALGCAKAQITALISMGRAYQALGCLDEAINCLDEALKIDANIEDMPYKRLECYLFLAAIYQDQLNYSMLNHYAELLVQETPKLKKMYPVYGLADFELASLLLPAEVDIYYGRLDDAQKKINEAEMIFGPLNIPYHNFRINEAKMYYYRARKEYTKMQQFYALSFAYCEEHKMESELRQLLKFNAETLSEMKLFKESVKAYESFSNHIDSVNKEHFLHEINRLRLDYELDKQNERIRQQNEELKLRSRLNIVFAILVILLFVTAFIIWVHLRSIKRKNYHLFNQIKELTKTKIELVNFKDRVCEKISTATNCETLKNSLFERTESFMRKEKPYINNEYGRKNLISDMNTNDVYLAKAIRSAVNKTIQEYINSWRMEYAKYLLLKDMTQTIETVAMDAGFTSIRHFYRLFKEQYGMSPTEFRNYVKENSQGWNPKREED